AHFSDCRFQNVSLRTTKLDHVWMQNSQWQDCDFHETDLTRLAALDTHFRQCAMKTALLAEAWLSQCTLQDLDLTGVFWEKVLLPDTTLERCVLAEATLSQCAFNRVLAPALDLTNVQANRRSRYRGMLYEACFVGATLDAVVIVMARLVHARLRNTSLRNARFYGASSLAIVFTASQLLSAAFSHFQTVNAELSPANP